MKISSHTKKAGLALLGSTLGYLIAKKLQKKDNYLYIMVGGFIGTCVAEELMEIKTKS